MARKALLSSGGLYAISDGKSQSKPLYAQIKATLDGGARIIQYRDKSSDPTRRKAEAETLLELCKAANALLIINDDIDLACEIAADGVHLGEDDAKIAQARSQLGPDAIIGISCYDQLDLAHQAQQQGANYVAFGSFFPSPTKPNAVRPGLDLLKQAKQEIELPIVAIGGITLDNGGQLIRSGADWLAVISALFASDDPYSAARAFTQLIKANGDP